MQESESERLMRLFPMEKDDFEPGKLWPPQPKQFPAPLEEFYHLIIGGDDSNLHHRKFHAFLLFRMIKLKEHPDPENEPTKSGPLCSGDALLWVDQRIAFYQNIEHKMLWNELANDYIQWWGSLPGPMCYWFENNVPKPRIFTMFQPMP